MDKQKELQNQFSKLCKENMNDLIAYIQETYCQKEYDLEPLYIKAKELCKDIEDSQSILTCLARIANEMTSPQASKFEYIASIFKAKAFSIYLTKKEEKLGITSFYQKIEYLVEQQLYGKYLLETYTKKEIEELEKYLDPTRNLLCTYSSLDLLMKRYLVKNHDNEIVESVQEMFMAIAMHLAMKEENSVVWAKKFYDVLSTWKVTMATPTMANARKPFHQLSSCFIDSVADSLDGIYRSVDSFAKVSKFGGGMGLYFGKVRAHGSSLRGFKGAAGGIARWIKLVNDTAVAVDQLGVRQGAVAVYLDAWHKDLPEFLQLKTNNGDDRVKAHDVFLGVCYPDLFWQLASEDLDTSWYMMCPHEIFEVMGYHLEDSYGKQWQEKYFECVNNPQIAKREMKIKDVVRLILKSVIETGSPFTFNRDIVNAMNPNAHAGMIYCSNLCSEIAQNVSSMEILPTTIETSNQETIVVERIKPGDFVVCNLASLVLGNIDVTNQKELEEVVSTTVRALDNVIDLNYYPLPYAKITSQKYRAIGLGTSGYHHMLVNQGIAYESEEHFSFVDTVYENINYYALQTSHQLAKERGSYSLFIGSDYQTGTYFTKRQYTSPRWLSLQQDIAKDGIRNGYLLAIAPTSSTSILAGTSAGIDPVLRRFYLEEKKDGVAVRVAPNLSMDTFWLYKAAHLMDQNYSIKAAGIRQRHIDQSQSMNLYITNEYTMRQILDLYIYAWKQQVKTIYYIRSQSLEIEDCDSCSA